MAKRVVIMDLSAILLAGIKGNKSRLWNVGAYPTGGLYSIFNKICAEVKKGSIIYIAADGAPYQKKERYPEYKGDRPASTSLSRNIFKVQALPVEKYAKDIGYKFIREAGYEADDIIYALAALYGGDQNYKVEILSADKDLHSAKLFGDNISLVSNTDKNKVDGNANQLWEKFLYGNKDNIPNLSKSLRSKAYQKVYDLVYNGYNIFEDTEELVRQGFTSEEIKMIDLCYYLAMPNFPKIKEVKEKITSMDYNVQPLVDLLTAFGLNMSLKSLGKTYSDANRNNVVAIQEDMYGYLEDEVIEYFSEKDQVYLNFVYESDEISATKVQNIIDKLKRRRE